MSEQERMQLQCWGVRGGIPISDPEQTEFGGNTSCLEVRLPDGAVLIFDGGSGIRALGDRLEQEAAGAPLSVPVFLTHFHWDHIQGIPFFDPLFDPRTEVTFCSFPQPTQLCDLLAAQMAPPYFPVSFDYMPARKNFMCMAEDDFRVGEAVVHAFPLNHPQGAYGYRVDAGGASVVFATDHEHGDPALDAVLRKQAEGADVLIYDAQYTPEEYAGKRGWGHSTWLEAARVASDAGVGRLILFHHDPGHSDKCMEAILRQARDHFPQTEVATEGRRIVL